MASLSPPHPSPPSSPRPLSPRRRGRIAVAVVTVLSIGIALYSVPVYLIPGEVDPRIDIREDNAIHLPVLIVHAATGGLALLLGPFQFFGRLRRGRPEIHRIIGRTYLLGGVLPSSLSGMIAAVLTVSGPIAMAAFLILDIVWLYSAHRAYRAAREHDFAAHERWMLRNMAFTFAAVTLRICLGLYVLAQIPLLEPVYGGEFAPLFSVAYTAAAVSCVAFNWLVIEVYLRRKKTRVEAAAATSSDRADTPG